ncbi:SAM-dependent methyltransferase [Candidatus Vidania fulgoroideorum]
MYKSYYKIKEINNIYKLIKDGIFLIELGCYPGGWSKYIKKYKNKHLKIDIKNIYSKKNFIKGNFYSNKVYKKIFFFSNYNKADLIISDLCPKISKIKFQNKIIFENLLKKIISFSEFFLKKNGNLIFKSMEYNNINILKNFFSYFKKVYKKKLKFTKKSSSEIFYICKDFLYEY